MNTLPKRQKEILEFIRLYIEDEGLPPTYQEIADRFHIQVGTVQEHLDALENKGAIERIKGRSRGIRLAEESRISPRPIALVGDTTAGLPALAIEHHEGYLTVDGSLIRGEDVFALRVKGKSMIEAGIMDNDYVLIRRQEMVEKGEAALVLVEGEEATIKKVYSRGRKVELRPANRDMKPMFFDSKRIAIQGKVVGVFRVV